ncbi:MAG: Uma2 family endonuclease [Acidobacteria bacterium]|nr:Uma2 family endonuclease [Acidobacteriota bacterium]
MSSQPITYLTPEEYLAIERKAEYKSEYVNGEMVAMTGASRKHNLIVVNIAGEIRQQLRGRPCELYANDMRVRVPATRLYTYPDVSVVCDEPQFEDDYVDTLLNPALIIEVLSESTEAYDRGKKFGSYRTIESLAEYLLVAQDEYRIEQYVKQPDGRWLLSDYRSPEDLVELVSIQCQLALKEVFDKVALS